MGKAATVKTEETGSQIETRGNLSKVQDARRKPLEVAEPQDAVSATHVADRNLPRANPGADALAVMIAAEIKPGNLIGDRSPALPGKTAGANAQEGDLVFPRQFAKAPNIHVILSRCLWRVIVEQERR